MTFSWLINGGDPNLLSGMILHTWRRHGSHGYQFSGGTVSRRMV